MMKGIISVIGKDNIGIIAEVCGFLSKNEINILEISQHILDGYFNMTMVVDISNVDDKFSQVIEGIEQVAKNIGVEIKLQRADIFDSMHRI
ncbi:ACT domain-containing protein [uncultured Tyzzerella sp.]|uniref:ACT domain-containing protein n=1 Tax=uncultured Tyzzerella sp. TaxID=2321398 RepID=UPI0029422D8C|nr:ACT domain-containing protein [uncultured Tyzzerella sp.]